MGLECTVLLADNSFYARNGDYGHTTRWDQQSDAFRSIFLQKTASNPESSVGLMTMAGAAPTLLVAPTREFGKVASALHGIKLQGQVDVMNGISAAQLALKHRQNKNQRQRVIVFVGSPLETASAADLVKLGKRLKKNNVAVDVVSFGEVEENLDKLQQFIDAVNSADNSRIVSVAAGTGLLSDMIVSSGMLSEDGAGPSTGAGPSGTSGSNAPAADGGDFGVDPNLDPELAMALRMSLEEERARQEAANRAASSSTSNTLAAIPEGNSISIPSENSAATSVLPAEATNSTDTTTAVGTADAMDEDDDLAAALALSREGEGAGTDFATAAPDDAAMDDHDLTEDEAIARAIAMSMKEQEDDGNDKRH